MSFTAASALPSETLPLDSAIGRVLAGDVSALHDVPHYASSAMDGWAVAGEPPWRIVDAAPLAEGQAVAVVTGGLIPQGARGVLRSEHARVLEGLLHLGEHAGVGEPRPGQHVRPAGEEARAHEVVVAAGTVVNPAHIALVAGCGLDVLSVVAEPRIALVFTGDEVVGSGIPAPGKVRDSFGPQLPSLVRMLGGRVIDTRRVGDDLRSTVAAIAGSAATSDVVITTGGTGNSDADHLRRALEELGADFLIDGVAMRPGKPSVLARLIDGRLVVGLPGNPLAAMMGVLTIAQPLIAGLGGTQLPIASVVVPTAHIDGVRGTMLVPYRLVDGRAVPTPWRGSGMMRGLAEADGVLVVPREGVQEGEPVEALPLPWIRSH